MEPTVDLVIRGPRKAHKRHRPWRRKRRRGSGISVSSQSVETLIFLRARSGSPPPGRIIKLLELQPRAVHPQLRIPATEGITTRHAQAADFRTWFAGRS